jgi:hypothetical protein
MGQKVVVFTTTLTVKDCANVFRAAGDAVRGGGMAKLFEAGATVAGNKDRTGYYTPSFDSPFAGSGVPDYAIGVNILKFSAGAQGNGTHVHMYVDDEGDIRNVQLISKHGFTDGGRSAKFTRKFLEQFQAADQQLRVTDGNL